MTSVNKHMIERSKGLIAIFRSLFFPEAAARAADIPVGQLIDKADKRLHSTDLNHNHPSLLLLLGSACCRRRASSDRSSASGFADGPLRLPLIDAGIGDKEAIGIPKRNQNLPQNKLHTSFLKSTDHRLSQQGYASCRAGPHRRHTLMTTMQGSG